MNDINFKKIFKQYSLEKGYRATFKHNGEIYHYKIAPIIECQMTHILSVFFRKIGINALLYDYDEETQISYCKSLYNKDEKFIEYPEDIQDDNYDLDNRYFVLKEKINLLDNSSEILEDFYKQFFIAALFEDSDKNTAYIIDKNNKVLLAPYYDLGTIFAIGGEYGYCNFFSDSVLIEKDMEKYCKECDYTRDEVMSQFNNQLERCMLILKENYGDLYYKNIIMDCLPNIPIELIDNIINFDIAKTIQNDNHIYSENSKKAIIGMINAFLETLKPSLEEYKRIKLNNNYSNNR